MGLKYLFYFVMFFFVSYDLGWWMGVVRPMSLCFIVWLQECVVEHWVDFPGLGDFKFTVDRVCVKFRLLQICGLSVTTFKPMAIWFLFT